MKKSLTVVVLIAALALTGCGKKADKASSSDTPTAAASTAPAVSGGFGAPVSLGDGITVTLSAPKSFKPGNFASNYLPGQAANVFDVALKNGSTAPIDPATISFAANSGTNTCTDVLDGDNGVAGAPTEPIAAGTTSNFKFAVGCDAKAGAPLHIDVTIGSSSAGIDGKIA